MGSGPSDMRSNKALIDYLVKREHVKKADVESALRSVDRGIYVQRVEEDDTRRGETPYSDAAWRSGNLHVSAPCIYGQVLDALELRPGLSFLNLGSGTGYLSTIIGLMIGPNGVNHGVEMHQDVIEYAQRKLIEFKHKSFAIDEFDFAEPVFIHGDCLRIKKNRLYDRVYLGACCRPEYESYCKELIKVGGVLVMPFNDQLRRYRRKTDTKWEVEDLLTVQFATVAGDVAGSPIQLPDIQPKTLLVLARDHVRQLIRCAIDHNYPDLRYSENLEERRRRREVSMSEVTREQQDTKSKDDENNNNDNTNSRSTDKKNDANNPGAGNEGGEDEDDNDDSSRGRNKRVRNDSTSRNISGDSSGATANANPGGSGSGSGDSDTSKRAHDSGDESHEDRVRRTRRQRYINRPMPGSVPSSSHRRSTYYTISTVLGRYPRCSSIALDFAKRHRNGHDPNHNNGNSSHYHDNDHPVEHRHNLVYDFGDDDDDNDDDDDDDDDDDEEEEEHEHNNEPNQADHNEDSNDDNVARIIEQFQRDSDVDSIDSQDIDSDDGIDDDNRARDEDRGSVASVIVMDINSGVDQLDNEEEDEGDESEIGETQRYNIHMREAIKELALPQALRVFVNFDREL